MNQFRKCLLGQLLKKTSSDSVALGNPDNDYVSVESVNDEVTRIVLRPIATYKVMCWEHLSDLTVTPRSVDDATLISRPAPHIL